MKSNFLIFLFYILSTTIFSSSESKLFFVNHNFIQVKNKIESPKHFDTLKKGTRVELLKEETQNSTKDDSKTTFSKISYKKLNKSHVGWVKKSLLSKNLKDSLPSKISDVSFSSTKKENYPSNPKKIVKGIYVSHYSVATPSSLNRLIDLANKSEINTFVIDVKNDDGTLLFKMPALQGYGVNSDKKVFIRDIKLLMKKLKDNNIYTIARIVAFKDPLYAKKFPNQVILNKNTKKPFTGGDGFVWISPYVEKYGRYVIDVAKEASKVGFNEIQFDYVRFPASNGGKLDSSLEYHNPKNKSKAKAIQDFLKKSHTQLSKLETYVGADTYGQVSSSYDDMGLGQHWEAISSSVDYISPMVYPSHYGKGVYGIPVPDSAPYKTVYASTQDSVNRNHNIDFPAEIRTWIQDFSAPWVKGSIRYGEKEVIEQIKALNDLGIKDYILWNSSNRYSFEKKLKKKSSKKINTL